MSEDRTELKLGSWSSRKVTWFRPEKVFSGGRKNSSFHGCDSEYFRSIQLYDECQAGWESQGAEVKEGPKFIKLTEDGNPRGGWSKGRPTGMEVGAEPKKRITKIMGGRNFEEVRPIRRRRSLEGSWVERHQGVASRLGWLRGNGPVIRELRFVKVSRSMEGLAVRRGDTI